MKISRLSEDNIFKINQILEAKYVELQDVTTKRPHIDTLYKPYLEKTMDNTSDIFTIRDKLDYELDVSDYDITYDNSSMLINSSDGSVCYLVTCQSSLGDRKQSYVDNMKQRYTKYILKDNPINMELVENDQVADFIDDLMHEIQNYNYDVFVNTLKLNVENLELEFSVYYDDDDLFIKNDFDGLNIEYRISVPKYSLKITDNSYYNIILSFMTELEKIL